MPAPTRRTGRVTPKAARPTTRPLTRPDTGRGAFRAARPVPDRRAGPRVNPARTGHRGGR